MKQCSTSIVWLEANHTAKAHLQYINNKPYLILTGSKNSLGDNPYIIPLCSKTKNGNPSKIHHFKIVIIKTLNCNNFIMLYWWNRVTVMPKMTSLSTKLKLMRTHQMIRVISNVNLALSLLQHKKLWALNPPLLV